MSIMEEENQLESKTLIQKFYAEQSILITGGTGFLGKLLIEKLLRSCPELTCIYVIVRPKKGQDAQNRFEQIFEDPLFERLKREIPKFRLKIAAVGGDCAVAGLGLSETDREFLISKISIVFNVAATVKFDEKLKQAVAINISGPKEMIDLSRRMDKLKAFIHVSTFYSNCIQKTIDEKFYDPPITGDNILNLVQCIDEEKLSSITGLLMGDFPNTYTYTKAIAEQVVRQYAKDLPTGIFRPAIVLSTYQEPVPGWVDNIFGPTGAVVAGGAGLLRVVQADKSISAELVPADFTVNALIASGWDVANKKNENDDPLIYNYCSSWNSSIRFEQYWNLALKYGKQIPSVKSVWCYSITVVRNYYLYYILCLFLHVLPALLIDVGFFITGRKTKAIHIYKKIHKFSAATSYFGLNEWNSKLDRTKSLWKRISSDDKKVFPFSMDNFDWEDYMKHYIEGLRFNIFKDTPDTIPAAKKRMSNIVLTHKIIKYIFLLFGVCASYIIISFILSLGWKNEFTFVNEKFIES